MKPEGAPGETAGDTLVLIQELRSPRERVWRCLTDPECFKVWWRTNLEFEAKLGGRFVEPWSDPSGRERVTRAEVTAFHPPEGFVMVWADVEWAFDTVVSVTLQVIDGGTRVTIEHQGWEKVAEPDRATYLLDHQAGWQNHLGNLAAFAEDLTSDEDEMIRSSAGGRP
ncbi:SRPBCC domain-containing protein [Jiella sp. MQZ9-1]|uniref:SRPBCC domain-containing protein n=1 Tax=Jiella flava TaxID=2816857 RepID=A0A939JWU9_9HYPH|nr:SRPBCC domain-containing protein [Jiella flava]MBO0662691.1 SRPBCC domain-containing protein [Jiella flava]MCD2471113.1 SRPBCC domain-containing protein [Jiella flava]